MPFRALTHGRVKRYEKAGDNKSQKSVSNSSKGLENSCTNCKKVFLKCGKQSNETVEPKVVIRNKNGTLATMFDFRKRNSQGKGKRALANPMPSVGGMSKFAKRAIKRRTNLSTKICCSGPNSEAVIPYPPINPKPKPDDIVTIELLNQDDDNNFDFRFLVSGRRDTIFNIDDGEVKYSRDRKGVLIKDTKFTIILEVWVDKGRYLPVAPSNDYNERDPKDRKARYDLSAAQKNSFSEYVGVVFKTDNKNLTLGDLYDGNFKTSDIKDINFFNIDDPNGSRDAGGKLAVLSGNMEFQLFKKAASFLSLSPEIIFTKKFKATTNE